MKYCKFLFKNTIERALRVAARHESPLEGKRNMLTGKITYDTVKQRQKTAGQLSPKRVPSEFMSNKFNNERPLKSNSDDLSFKGLSFKGENSQKPKGDDKMKPLLATLGVLVGTGLALRFAPSYKKVGEYSISEFLKFIEEKAKIEPTAIRNHIEHLQNSKLTKNLIKTDGDTITLSKKTIPQLIWDGLMYPFKILPADILNGTVGLAKKIKPLKNWAEKTYEKPFFKNIRQRSKVDAQVNSLRGMFEMQKELEGKPAETIASKMFQQSVKSFDSTKGQYDTKHERSLNRLVSGLPPALFLANDAYNLSRMMDDDDKAAKHEQKTRFKQEAARIGFNAYITLITLGALQKYINNSSLGIMLMTGATTLTTEAFSRLINGKHITRLTPEEARAENQKNNAPEAQIKPELSFKASENKDSSNDKQQKPLLSFDTVMKASAVIIAGGFGVKALRKIPSVEKQWKAFTGIFKNWYKNTTEIFNYTISQEKLDKIADVLQNNGFKELSAKYRKVAGTAENNGLISLGSADKTFKFLEKIGMKNVKIKPFVNFVIAPFKFAWNTVTLPYNLTMKVVKVFQKVPDVHKLGLNDKTTIKNIIKNYAKEKNITDTKNLEAFAEKLTSRKLGKNEVLSELEQGLMNRLYDVDSLAKSIENIGKEALKKNFSPKEFQSYVKDNIMKSFNAETRSNLSNSELSNLAKTAASIATIWFLMTDNYNMVMLKSNGNDVQGAKTKFTERFVQEGSRLFYQTLLIDLFNSTFRSQYNKSLFGMSWITLTNTTLGEWLTRASVGVPVGTHSRDSLLKLEEKQNNATGFKKSYFNFMKRLTGKRSIKSYEVAPKNAEVKISNQELLNFTNNKTFEQFIK